MHHMLLLFVLQPSDGFFFIYSILACIVWSSKDLVGGMETLLPWRGDFSFNYSCCRGGPFMNPCGTSIYSTEKNDTRVHRKQGL